MGDHRASVKIEFSIYGEKYTMDSWINWSVGGQHVREVDDRVIEFFQNSYLDARDKWEEASGEADRRRKEEAEAVERAEYERLKKKFEPDGSPPTVKPGQS